MNQSTTPTTTAAVVQSKKNSDSIIIDVSTKKSTEATTNTEKDKDSNGNGNSLWGNSGMTPRERLVLVCCLTMVIFLSSLDSTIVVSHYSTPLHLVDDFILSSQLYRWYHYQ
jgi:hypothetical protein